jgi:DNA-binding response OmpR family regulator
MDTACPAPQTPRRILIVEDEPELARLLQRQIQQASYDVTTVLSGEEGLRAAGDGRFDLVLLDVMLPGIDGLETCRRLRDRQYYMPVLMLTARSTEVDKVLGLETGADDYMTKPFSVQELLARIKAIFRCVDALESRARNPGQRIAVGGTLRIDPDAREVQVHGERVALTHREFDLLLFLAQNPGRVYSRGQLLDSVWGYTHEGYEHAVNCHINRLRAKIERDPGHPELLLTVWGVGYKFTTDVTVTTEVAVHH